MARQCCYIGLSLQTLGQRVLSPQTPLLTALKLVSAGAAKGKV